MNKTDQDAAGALDQRATTAQSVLLVLVTGGAASPDRYMVGGRDG